MGYPAVTNTFVASSTAKASEVNQNFTDIINGITDTTKDLNVNDVTVNGSLKINSSVDTRDVIPQVDDTYDLGTAAKEFQDAYLDGKLYVDEIQLETNQKVQFRDGGLYVNSDNDGYLDLHADTAVRVSNNLMTLGTLDVTTTSNMSGAVSVKSTIGIVGSATMSGSVAVYGATTLVGAVGTSGAVTLGNKLTFQDMYPVASNTHDIGSAAAAIKDIHVDGVGYIDNVAISAAGGVQYRDVDTYINSPAQGFLGLVASTAVRVYAHLIPNTNNTRDIGSSAVNFKDLYLAGTAYLYGTTEHFQARSQYWDANVYVKSDGDGALDIYADGTVDLNTPSTRARHVEPIADATYQLGSSTAAWSNIYSRAIQGLTAASMTSSSKLSFGNAATAYLTGGATTATVFGLVGVTIESPVITLQSGAVSQNGGNVLINDAIGSYDFTVQGNGQPNVLHVDGATNKIGVLTSGPSATLTVVGTASVSGLLFQTADTGTAILNRYQNGSFTATPQGISTAAAVTFHYTKVGKMCTLYIPKIYGVSTAATFSIPTASFVTGTTPRNVDVSDMVAHSVGGGGLYKSGTVGTSGAIVLDSDRIYFCTSDGTDYNAGGWPTSDDKGMKAALEITYQTD